MLIYYLLYTLLIVGFLPTFGCENKKRTRNYCIFAFILIASTLAFRHPSMGIDLHYGTRSGYLGMFEIIGKSSWDKVLHSQFKNYERGYVIFCKVLNYLSRDPQILLIFSSIISIFSVFFIIYKFSDNYLLSYIIYLGLPVFLLNYSGIRQVLAIAITTFSYIFIRNKKLIPFVLTVLLAATFHNSAIVFLIAYPIYYLKIMTNSRLLTIATLPVVYLLRRPLFAVLSKLLKDNAIPDNNSALTLFLVFSAVYVFTLIYSDKNNIHNEGLMNLFWLTCVCQAFGDVYSIAIRVGYYFMIYLLLLIPKTVKNINSEIDDNQTTGTVAYIVIFLCFAIFGLYSIRNGTWSMSYPYHFFWQE